MQQSKRYNRSGQVNIFNEVEGLDKLVTKPNIAESEGYAVVHVVVSEEDDKVPGYTEMALKLSREILPEVKSIGRPPWLDADWQTNRRKQRNGVN